MALGSTVLPPASFLGITLRGTLGLEVVMSQGCQPIGPTYRVTSIDGPAIHQLNHQRAIDQLDTTIQSLPSTKDQTVARHQGVLAGVYHCPRTSSSSHIAANSTTEELPFGIPGDFHLRQVTGFRPRSGTIMVCGPQIQEGDYLQFHIQSPESALQDWTKVLKRAHTERLVWGQHKRVAALQITCLARGKSLQPDNMDLHHVQQLWKDPLPMAGCFVNAEIAPTGMNLPSELHGFATVVAMLCDYTPVDEDFSMTTCLANATDLPTSWA